MTPQEELDGYIKQGVDKVELVFSPLITAIDIQIEKLEKAGKDPSSYYDLDEDRCIDFVQKRGLIVEEKKKAIARFRSTMLENQKSSWDEIAFELLKEALEDGVKITIGEYDWNSMHVIGKKNTLFYELRDDALQAIGTELDIDLGLIIKDPFYSLRDSSKKRKNESEEMYNAIDKEAGNTLKKIKGITGKFFGYTKLIGVFVLIINTFIIIERKDILEELFQGRSSDEVEITDLILPICLLVFGIFLIIKNKKNASPKDNS